MTQAAIFQSASHEAPKSGVRSIQALIETVSELSELMSRETDLLRSLQIRDFSALQDKKLSLIASYEQKTRDLRETPGFADNMEPRLRAELVDAAERMQAIMKENEQAIRTARDLNQRVATAIVEAVQADKPTADTYSSKGGYQTSDKTPPVSVQIDGRY